VTLGVNCSIAFFCAESDGKTQFCEVLIHHIHKILQDSDDICEDRKEWVSNEAINVKSLQYGGTFRNVLSRKVDEVVVPIFSEIIAAIDQNYNLNILIKQDKNPALSQFWLNIFSDSSIMQFDYITSKEPIPVRKAEGGFDSCFPFSWLVYEIIEGQWDKVRSSTGKYKLSPCLTASW
jgi:hypothetical protein